MKLFLPHLLFFCCLFLLQHGHSQNLVQNGNFEISNPNANPGFLVEVKSSLSGITTGAGNQQTNDVFAIPPWVADSVDILYSGYTAPSAPMGGNQHIDLNEIGYIYQEISGLQTGATYHLSFYTGIPSVTSAPVQYMAWVYMSSTPSNGPGFRSDFLTRNTGAPGWRLHEYEFVAPGSTVFLNFRGMGASGPGVNPAEGMLIDRVQLTRPCCDNTAGNLIQNGDFSMGNVGFTSDYVFANLPGSGQYTVKNDIDATSVAPCWDTGCSPPNNRLFINGRTGRTFAEVVYRVSVPVIPGETYNFCADFLNLASCCFDVKPVVNVHFGGTNGSSDIVGSIIDQPQNACAWKRLHSTVTIPANWTLPTLLIEIILEEFSNGDGNDLAIDNILFAPQGQVPGAAVLFNVNYQNVTSTKTEIAATPVTPLPPGCSDSWSVAVLDANFNDVPGTVANNPLAWSPPASPFLFPGYNGIGAPIGTSPGVFQLNRRYRLTYTRECPCKLPNSRTIIQMPGIPRLANNLTQEELIQALVEKGLEMPAYLAPGAAAAQPRNHQGEVLDAPAVQVRATPNPARDKVTFTVETDQPYQEGTIEIFDATGKVVQTLNLGSRDTGTMELSQLGSGMYFFRWTVGGSSSQTKKLIIQ